MSLERKVAYSKEMAKKVETAISNEEIALHAHAVEVNCEIDAELFLNLCTIPRAFFFDRNQVLYELECLRNK